MAAEFTVEQWHALDYGARRRLVEEIAMRVEAGDVWPYAFSSDLAVKFGVKSAHQYVMDRPIVMSGSGAVVTLGTWPVHIPDERRIFSVEKLLEALPAFRAHIGSIVERMEQSTLDELEKSREKSEVVALESAKAALLEAESEGWGEF